MINKFSSIDNASHKQKKYNEIRGEMYLITASDSVWAKWKSIFKKHETRDLIVPESGSLYNQTPHFKQMKPLVREFRALQELSDKDIENAASHILHVEPTAKRCWVHPKIAFIKPIIFVPSCYIMKKWAENRKKKTTIV